METTVVVPGPASNPASQLTARAHAPLESVVAAVERAIADQGMLVLHRLDPQRILSAHGYGIAPARQLFFFHPRFMARLLAVDPAAVVEVPLKIALVEDPHTNTVVARMADPRLTMGAYSGLEQLGAELSESCERILTALASVSR